MVDQLGLAGNGREVDQGVLYHSKEVLCCCLCFEMAALWWPRLALSLCLFCLSLYWDHRFVSLHPGPSSDILLYSRVTAF